MNFGIRTIPDFHVKHELVVEFLELVKVYQRFIEGIDHYDFDKHYIVWSIDDLISNDVAFKSQVLVEDTGILILNLVLKDC